MVKGPSLVFPATVNTVNRQNLTCTVTPPDGVKLPGVRLKAGIEEVEDGLVEIPAIDSSVLVVVIGNTDENAFVAKCSQVDEVLFYGGQNGGLIKIQELVKELEKVNTFLSAIQDGFAEWIPPTGAPDSGASLRAIINTKIGALPTSDYSNIENLKIKH